MLNPKDITVREQYIMADRVTKLTAEVRIGAESHIDEFAMRYARAPEEMKAHVKAQLVHAIWQRLYGDLHKEIRELQHLALRNESPFGDQHVRNVCEKINGMLSIPHPTTE